MNPQSPQPLPPQMPSYQQQSPMPPAHQPMTKQKKLIIGISFGVLALIVLVSIVLGIVQNNGKKHAPVSLIPGADSINLKSRDTERETDIKAMHGQIEAYWAQNGYYPTLANLNDFNFLNTNLKGLDLGALQDPLGNDSKIVNSPKENAYSYEVLPSGCDNVKTQCQSYTLTATLEGTLNGAGTYIKKSLNE
ncbi:MAG: hypothetical protein JWO47_252 [Candidatus Saccharibacteria bacterium]|nr:hypothetical protein [Candidatus Saccharibacteria bacterium]